MLKFLLLMVSIVSASIKGPSEMTVGQLAVLDGGESQGDRMQWKVPPEFQALPSKDMELALTCDTPGKYMVILVAVDKDLEIAVATHEITVSSSGE